MKPAHTPQSEVCVHVTPNRNYICAQGKWYIDTPANRLVAENDATLFRAAPQLLKALETADSTLAALYRIVHLIAPDCCSDQNWVRDMIQSALRSACPEVPRA